MTVAEKMFQKKVNIKFTTKSSQVVSEREVQETAPCSTMKSNLKVKLKLSDSSNKRKSELVLDVPEEKRRKMDQIVKRHCSIILKELLSHPAGWIFSKPVDPVALCLPDYFSIISDPMDLGTIKSKLEDNRYFSSEEFAADVCLTFSNAMLYNPPDNPAHQYARELDHHFKRRWKFQLASWNHQNKGVGLIPNGSGINAQNGADALSKKLKSDVSLGAKNSTTEEKHGLRKEIMVILRSLKSTEKLRELLQRFNLKEGELGPNISAFGVSALKELKSALKSFSDSNYDNSIPAKIKVNGLESLSGKVLCKGACSVVNSKQSVSSISPLCGLCRGGSRQCHHQKSRVPTSSNVSEKSLKEVNHTTNSKSRESEGKVSLTHGSVSSDHDSDGPGSVLDEDNTLTSCGLSVPLNTGASNEGCSPLMDDQSLKKALRAAMLKSRFADTIMKANGDKADPRKMHQEREQLERLQREEAAKIDAQRKEEELKLKMMLDKERQAARIALEKMERTVELEDNLKGLRELEMLSQCSSSDFILAFGVSIDKRTAQFRKPLELIGLRLKEDEVDEVELGLNGEREEGEIIQ